MGKRRGIDSIAILEGMFKAIPGIRTQKRNAGYLTVFGRSKCVPNRIAICVYFIMPAWTTPDNKPTTLFNHVSFYMKDVDRDVEGDERWANAVKGKVAQELEHGLWSCFQNEFREHGYKDMVFGANEHNVSYTEWYYRPTKFWSANEVLDIFYSVAHILSLMCKTI